MRDSRYTVHATNLLTPLTIEAKPIMIALAAIAYEEGEEPKPIMSVTYSRHEFFAVRPTAAYFRNNAWVPWVGLYNNLVQIVFPGCPIVPEISLILRRNRILAEIERDIAKFNVLSVADISTTPEAISVFERCFKRQESFALRVFRAGSSLDRKQSQELVEAFSVRELHQEAWRAL